MIKIRRLLNCALRAPLKATRMTLRSVSLDDKYDLAQSHVLVTGYQALIRALLMQKERDRRAGINTGGYVTGYRGSPLGGLDQQMMRVGRFLAAHDVKFQPGINEELAATALWGTQQAELRGEGKFDGVFGMWYGKGLSSREGSPKAIGHVQHVNEVSFRTTAVKHVKWFAALCAGNEASDDTLRPHAWSVTAGDTQYDG